MNTQLDHLSYSSISSYLLCARAWKFHYLEKIETPTSPELVFGSAFHGAVETHIKKGGSELMGAWLESWNTNVEGKQIAWGADTPESFFNQGVKMLSDPKVQYELSCLKPAIENEKPMIETRVTLKVPGVPIPLIGYIDIITQDNVPGDFKTSARSWTSDKAASETQSLFYLAALNQMGRPTPGWEFRHYIFVKTKTPQVQVLPHTHKASEMFWLFGMIQNVWKGIEAGVFPENPTGWKCNPAMCDFWNLCRGKYD